MSEQEQQTQGYYQYEENHPIVSLILLLLLVVAGYILFGTVSLFLAIAITDVGGTEGLIRLLSGEGENADALKIIQAGSSIGMFIVPALTLPRLERFRTRYLDFTTPINPLLWLIVPGIVLFSAPLMEQIITLNEQMKLPASLSDVEAWMQAREEQMKVLTRFFLSDTTYTGLIINLIVVAVIPAVGEEFIFRGCLQNIMKRWFGNPHAAIWVAAIIFSAIHLQFYGFFPRLLLGAFFGYLLYWGKNIWLPIFAHFLNNGIATVSAFVAQRQGKSFDDVSFGEHLPAYVYGISAMVTVYLFILYRRTAVTANV